MRTDDSQSRVRRSNDVRQNSLDPVIEKLNDWATPGADPDPRPPLLKVIDESGHGPLTQSRLKDLLPGFGEMKKHDQLATVAAIARMSHQFHNAHAVDESGGSHIHSRHNPKRGQLTDPAPLARTYAAAQEIISRGGDPDAPAEMRKEKRKFTSLWNKKVDTPAQSKDPAVQATANRLRPDFSGKNYAVLEVQKTNPDGTTETHYIIDSSVPANDFGHSPDHSEPVLGEAFRKLDAEHPNTYQATAMYTEFEPCGDQTHPASANCSYYLSHEFERPKNQERTNYHDIPEEKRAGLPDRNNSTDIYYAAGYRLGDLSPERIGQIREQLGDGHTEAALKEAINAARQEARDKRDEDMHRARGEMLRVWMKVASY